MHQQMCRSIQPHPYSGTLHQRNVWNKEDPFLQKTLDKLNCDGSSLVEGLSCIDKSYEMKSKTRNHQGKKQFAPTFQLASSPTYPSQNAINGFAHFSYFYPHI